MAEVDLTPIPFPTRRGGLTPEAAAERGLRCSLTPAATALPTLERLQKAKEAGIRRIALSLDAPSPEVHDAFRQVPGSWERTMKILRNAQPIGLSAQINTTVTRHNVDLLPDMVKFVQEVETYRHHPLFRDLRDPAKLKGRCGACEYKVVCGGQRGRAYALTGDYLESDPACIYQPRGRTHA